MTESSPATRKASSGPGPMEDLYYRTYPVHHKSPQDNMLSCTGTGERNTRALAATGDNSFPAPPPPPYCNNHLTPDVHGGVRSTAHTYESPNFTTQMQRDPTTGMRRGSDVNWAFERPGEFVITWRFILYWFEVRQLSIWYHYGIMACAATGFYYSPKNISTIYFLFPFPAMSGVISILNAFWP